MQIFLLGLFRFTRGFLQNFHRVCICLGLQEVVGSLEGVMAAHNGRVLSGEFNEGNIYK